MNITRIRAPARLRKGSSACLKCIFNLAPSETVYGIDWFKDVDLIYTYVSSIPTFMSIEGRPDLEPYKAALPFEGFEIDVST